MGAHRLPQGRGAAGAGRRTVRRAARRELRHLVDAFGRDRVAGRAVGPRRPARLAPQRRAGRAGRAGTARLRRHEQRPLRHAGTPPAGHRARRRAAPGAASTRSTRGCRRPRSPTCAPVRSRRAASPRYPGVVEARPSSDGLPRSTSRSSRRSCRRSLPGRERTEHERDAVPPRRHRGRCAPPLRRAAAPDETSSLARGPGQPSTTSSRSSSTSASPATSSSCGTSSSSAAARTSSARGGAARRTRAVVLRARHHEGRCGVARLAVRALPVARARRPAGHRHRHRIGPARRGHPVRLRASRPAPHRAGGERHHLPRTLERA